MSGLWSTDRVPYLRKIMDAFNDDYIESIIFMKSAQIGATEAGINIIAYTIDQEPCRILYVLPDDDIAKDFSSERLRKALRNCPRLDNKFDDADSKNKVLRFPGGFIRLEGAQSPGKLASWPIPKIIMDEIDKYPRWAGREANPIALAEERAKNWPSKKMLLMSTPTLESGNIYQQYMRADAKYKFYIQCPKCGEWQTLVFEQLKIPHKKGNMDASMVAKEAYYQCCNPTCNHHISDAEKKEALKHGVWRLEGDRPEGRPKKIAFHINAMYSPWVSFGMVAEKFARSKDDPSELMNFVNSWLGEPWKPKTEAIAATTIIRQKTDIPANIIPKWAKLITGGVDCQQGYFYWIVRAWGPNMTSQLVANGQAVTFGDIQRVMDNWWPVEDSEERQQVTLYCVDSGYNTEDVYSFCYDNFPISVPVKGASRQMTKRYMISPIQPKTKGQNTLNLYVVDTDQYKDSLFAHAAKPPTEEGSWRVNSGVTREYAEMICAEHKTIIPKGKYEIATWVKNTSASPNHYLDCEVYAAVAADIMNVRTLTPDYGKPIYSGTGKVDAQEMIPKKFKL